MTIKDMLKRLCKCSNKNKNHDGDPLFRDIPNDLYNLSLDEYKKKYTKVFEKDIKNISSLSKEEKEKKYAEIRRGLQMFKELKLSNKLIGDLVIKYDFTYHYIEKYRDELKKDE